jgi:putative phosphoribosyl transferase
LFRNRKDAGRQLALKLKTRHLHHPLVLAIPRGGIVTGAALARDLGADLDVVLSRKLRDPQNPELALGAVAEDGYVYVTPDITLDEQLKRHIERETRHQIAEMARRKKLFRDVRGPAPVQGRSVMITDDGIATGSTMTAALQTIRAKEPREIIVAVPVAPRDRLQSLAQLADSVVCLESPEVFWAVGQFYEDFTQVEDEEAVREFRDFGPPQPESHQALLEHS